VIEWLSLKVRPLRHGHRHAPNEVISLRPFVNLPIHSNSCWKGFYEFIYYLVLIVVPDDELNIDAINGFVKGMRGLHPKPEGEDLECYCGDVCKMEVSSDYKTLW
jgi:hypothetical protein